MIKKRAIVFISILSLAVVLVLGVLALKQFNLLGDLTLQRGPTAAIQVAVPPALFDWAQAAAQEYPRGGVTVTAVRSLDVITAWANQSASERPQAWVPEAIWVAAIAQEQGLNFETLYPSLTTSDMVWGAFENRRAALIQADGALDWAAIHRAAASKGWSDLGGDETWGYFKLVLAPPGRSAEGLAALLAAAAAFHQQPALTYDHIAHAGFLDWLKIIVGSVPNWSALGADPAESLAARGPSIGDAGMLSAATWNRARPGLSKWGVFVTATPRYTVRLDYPYLARTDLSPAEREAARRFGQYLLERVGTLDGNGFAAVAAPATLVSPDTAAVLGLYHWAQRERVGP